MSRPRQAAHVQQGCRAFAPATDATEGFNAFCEEIGRSPADVALAWVAGQPGVTAPIVGPRSMAQFEANLAAVATPLTPEVRARLDKLFPGPGGAAPEAYAW